ncbi:hypothetical protein AvCA_03410 [Azotobacter vinelandii CA]|uniref:Uncharacterized protein n=2 Tax=Azotobacter vinelandii TaxID=354 RepID=C1DIA4_AZOVD|nr:hypothetical protein Avin_03410 [Azotobacter vinelandii DJ]AGK17342.1 hypothetical protein AvCA_03410 [Azotobacter vinelandii CA]AGK19229.1 hypothetical protein AvCA6_03410 [Azotobacter vinelandii CA6]
MPLVLPRLVPKRMASPPGQGDQAAADESDGQQRHESAGLQQEGAEKAEQKALQRRGRAAPEQFLQAAAGELLEPFFQTLHAEQKEREPRAQAQPAGAEPEGIGQTGADQENQKEFETIQGPGLPVVAQRLAPSARTASLRGHRHAGKPGPLRRRHAGGVFSPAGSRRRCSRGNARRPPAPARRAAPGRLPRRCRSGCRQAGRPTDRPASRRPAAPRWNGRDRRRCRHASRAPAGSKGGRARASGRSEGMRRSFIGVSGGAATMATPPAGPA